MTVHFAIGTFHDGMSTFPGLVIDEAVYDISKVLSGVVDTATLLQGWQQNFNALSLFAEDQQRRAEAAAVPFAGLQILPPVSPMGQLLAAGANYRQHVIEITVAHKLGDPDASEDELREQAAREVYERRNSEPVADVAFPPVQRNHCKDDDSENDAALRLGESVAHDDRGQKGEGECAEQRPRVAAANRAEDRAADENRGQAREQIGFPDGLRPARAVRGNEDAGDAGQGA